MTPEERLVRKRAQAKARYAANPEKRLVWQRAYNAAHPERKRAWYLKNAEQERAKARLRALARYYANREQILTEQRAWRVDHPEDYRAEMKARTLKHQTKNRARAIAWYAAHSERAKMRIRAWTRQRPDWERARKVRRRALKLHAPVCDFTQAEWDAMKAAADGRCHYCGAIGKLTLDHKQALTRGGSHTASNIVPACVRCNCRKSARPYDEYLRVVNG